MEKVVKMKIHAGGGWEGHVVYTGIHPDNPDITHMASNLDEIRDFCKKHKLIVDKEFENLVLKKLSYEHRKGFVIPTEFIEESAPITSAWTFLKINFPNYK